MPSANSEVPASVSLLALDIVTIFPACCERQLIVLQSLLSGSVKCNPPSRRFEKVENAEQGSALVELPTTYLRTQPAITTELRMSTRDRYCTT